MKVRDEKRENLYRHLRVFKEELEEQIGLTLDELDQLEEGMLIDLLIEQGNDAVADEVYCEVAGQAQFDAF